MVTVQPVVVNINELSFAATVYVAALIVDGSCRDTGPATVNFDKFVLAPTPKLPEASRVIKLFVATPPLNHLYPSAAPTENLPVPVT